MKPYFQNSLHRICFSIIIFYFLFPRLSHANKIVVDQIVETVNDSIILLSELEEFMKKARSKAFREQFGGIDDKSLSDPQKMLDILTEEKIVDGEVKKLQLQATERQVEQQINSILSRNHITMEQLKLTLQKLGSSEEEYNKGVARQIERANIIEHEIKPMISISEDSLRHFYMKKNQSSSQSMRYHLAHIYIQGKSKASKTRASRVYQALITKEHTFKELAEMSSDDINSKDKEGDIGFFTQDSLLNSFKVIIPKLEPNEISKPIPSDDGFHIVRVLSRGPQQYQDLSKEEKDQLRQEFAALELEQKMIQWIQKKKTLAYIKKFPFTIAGIK